MAELPQLTGTVRIPINGFARYEAALGRSIRQEVFSKSMRSAGKEVRLLLEHETLKRRIFHKKNFARSWRMVIGNIPSSVRVLNTAPYAIVIERGRRAGARRPPSNVLVPWVEDKLGLRGAAARGMAFVIARNIGERGIAARPIIRDPLVRAKIEKVVTKAVIRSLKVAMERTK